MLTLVMAALTFASGEPPILPEPIVPPKPANLKTETFEKAAPLSGKSTPHISSKIAHVKGSEQDCIRKSFATLSSQVGFRFAELKPEKAISGYTDTHRVVVLITPAQDECVVVVLLAGWDDKGFDLVKRIADQLEIASQETKSVKSLGRRDQELEKTLPALLWHLETHKPNHLTRNFRHFGNTAALFMEKYGYEKVIPIPPDETVPSVCTLGLKRENLKILAATLVEVGKGESVVFLTAGVTPNEEDIRKDVNTLSADLLKWFYE